MRIRQLDLDLFGRFAGQVYDFGPGGEGSDFHLVYGPNEAGKTTTMEGFLRLLYGFPHREPYDFLHQRRNLKVSGRLEIDGQIRDFVRLPTQKGNLVDTSGAVLPENALAQHLGGLTLADYRSLLCLDDQTIETGGEDIANARGNFGTHLFSAAAGIANLNAVLDAARDDADKLYRKRASTTQMAELKRELEEVNRQIRDRDVTAGAWKALKQDVQAAETAEAAARTARDALRTRLAEAQARARALPLLAEHDALAAQVAPFAAYPDRLDIRAEDLVTLTADLGRAEDNRDRLTDEIAETEAALATLDPDPAQVDLGPALEVLGTLRDRAAPAAIDLPKRRQEMANLQQDMANVARDLSPDRPPDAGPEDLVRSAPQIAALEQARERMRQAERARDTGAQEVADLDRSVTEAEAAIVRIRDDAPAHTGCADLLARHDLGALERDLATARAQIGAARDRVAEALDNLAIAGLRFADLPAGPVDPLTAADLARRHADLTEEIRTVTSERDRWQTEAEVNAARIARLEAGTGPVGDAEAAEARATRDALWQAHLADLSAVSAAAFEPAMQRVDGLAEARLAHAADLGQLRQLDLARIDAETHGRRAADRLARMTEEADGITAQVADRAAALGLPALAPDAFHAWADRHDAAVRAEARLDRVIAAHQEVLNRVDGILAALRPLLPLEDPDFDSALAAARRLAEAETRHRDMLKTAAERAGSLKKDRDRRRAALADLEAVAEAAAADWTSLVADLFGAAVVPAVLDRALARLHELRALDVQRMQVARQVQGMEADAAQFRDSVAQLADAHGLEVGDDPLATFDILRGLKDAAVAMMTRRETLSKTMADRTERLCETQGRLNEIARTVQDIGRSFPDLPPGGTLGDTLAALRSTVAVAHETIERRARMRALETRILAGLAAPDLDAARQALAGATAPALEAEAASLLSDLDAAEAALSAATAQRANAARDLATITGDAGVAELVERRTTLELRIEQTVLDYLRHHLGLKLADEAIRRYRDTHRSGMMEATERAFADLTANAYPALTTRPENGTEILLARDAAGGAKQVGDMSKGTRFQLYLALRAAAYEQLVSQGVRLPFFCDDIFETFDEDRTRAACRLMERIGRSGQAIYLTHHRHVVDIAREVCSTPPIVHEIAPAKLS
ncbi:YhaN family protein [Chachezhania sediminis]|uniref:YhaN family protein n=1 Tax=Chachezhania sediminis TaxID=2599291 RepID=UPI00131CDB07|nr:YhaN family protein [Chachezhania sediminis]